MRKKKPEKELNAERWLLTYSDLITLLMAFFIVMYASSSVNQAKMAKVAAALSAGFNGSGKTIIGNEDAVDVKDKPDYIEEMEKQAQDTSSAAEKAEENKLQQIKEKVDNYVDKNGLSSSITTTIQEKGLVIRVVDTMMFETGKADINSTAQQRLVEMAQILKTIDNYVVVEGHTDNRPIHTDEFVSNEELSGVRACNVKHVLVDIGKLPASQVSFAGYGDTRPLVPNDNETDMAKNRRVDIIVINSKYNAIEKAQ